MHDHDLFPTQTAGLAEASSPQWVRLAHGDRFDLDITAVHKTIAGADLRMLAYNGSIPGPTLHVDQGTEITVRTRNDGDIDTTVHWHGLRLENRYDGVPHDTQDPIGIGDAYDCSLQFPDPGVYWYHPHLREDFAQEMGLYGTIVVEPRDPGYWPPVDRQMTITLDDLLVEDGRMAPFHRSGPTHTAMGRFGNVMLVNGAAALAAQAAQGEVVRLHLVNTANTRIFNVAIAGAAMKLVGGDSGRYERETIVEEVLLAPSERAVVDVHFNTAGIARLQHRTPDRVHDLGTFTVTSGSAVTAAGAAFPTLRVDPELLAQRKMLEEDAQRAPDKILAFRSLMPLLYGDDDGSAASSYSCPMHPQVTGPEPATCPLCGMRLVATELVGATATDHGHDMHHGHAMDHGNAMGHGHGMDHPADHGDGLEWEDLMPEINRRSDASNMIWQLVDEDTGAVNGAIDWAFSVGDRVRIRLVNAMDSDHPMHHPFHVHGAGRFLVLSRDEQPESNLVWKDTVLVPAGQTVDILLDVSNPGRWMAHCHIAEHAEVGMMFTFDVSPASVPTATATPRSTR